MTRTQGIHDVHGHLGERHAILKLENLSGSLKRETRLLFLRYLVNDAMQYCHTRMQRSARVSKQKRT